MRRTGTLCATFVLIGLGSAAPAQAAAPPECGFRPATIVGTEGPDVITGTPGFDVIVGLGGNDSVSGAIGGDFVCGGSGDDEIISPRGLVAYGDEGNDRIEVGEGSLTDVARIHGRPGNDVLVNRGLVQTSAATTSNPAQGSMSWTAETVTTRSGTRARPFRSPST